MMENWNGEGARSRAYCQGHCEAGAEHERYMDVLERPQTISTARGRR